MTFLAHYHSHPVRLLHALAIDRRALVSHADIELVREWAQDIAQKWHSRPSIYMHDPLGGDGSRTDGA